MSPKHALFALTLATTAAACAAEEQGPSTASADLSDPSTEPSMLLPVSNFARPTNIDHYRVFASHAEALAWFEGYAATRSSPPDHALPEGDPRYADVAARVAPIWSTFKALFPRDTEGLDAPPQVVLVERSDVNAYATLDPALACKDGGPAECSPHAFMIHTAALGGDGFDGLVAHELAHHVLKHAWPGNAEKIARYYTVGSGPGFGFQRTNDPAVEAPTRAWVAAARMSGAYPIPQLHDLPFGLPQDLNPITTARLIQLVLGADTTTPSCIDALDLWNNQLRPLWASSVDFRDQSVTSDPAKLADVDARATRFIDAANTCFTAQGAPADQLLPTLAQLGATTPEAITKDLAPGTVENVNAAPNMFDAVLRLNAANHAAMKAFRTAPVRVYSYEEEADDTALQVMARAGLDPVSLARFFEFVLRGQQTACPVTIGAEPAYGNLVDAHHAVCWRIDHQRQVARFVAR